MSEYRQNCEDECPARGVGLMHVHSRDCKHGHSAAYCCECYGEFIHLAKCRHDRTGEPSAGETDLAPPIPVVSVAGQLSALGITSGPTSDLSPDCIIDHESLADWSECGRCGVMHEPKTALGHPVGPPYGPGRSWYGDGELSPRDKARLTFLIDHTVRREVPA